MEYVLEDKVEMDPIDDRLSDAGMVVGNGCPSSDPEMWLRMWSRSPVMDWVRGDSPT
jgi:hypothetical protein